MRKTSTPRIPSASITFGSLIPSARTSAARKLYVVSMAWHSAWFGMVVWFGFGLGLGVNAEYASVLEIDDVIFVDFLKSFK